MPHDDAYLREAVDRAREEYHDALRRADQTPKDWRSRDTAWVAVRDAMNRYQTAMHEWVASLGWR